MKAKNSPQINLNDRMQECWDEAYEIAADCEDLDASDFLSCKELILERAEKIMDLLSPFVADQAEAN